MSFISLVPAIYYNIKQYGALGDGSSDDTAFIADARSAANAAGGGVVWWPKGTFITGNLTHYNNVIDLGSGIGTTIVKLKNGANTDLFSANTGNINLSGAVGAGSATGVIGAGICNMTLDGNKANQSSGTSYPIRGYGYNFTLQNVEIKNGYTGGILWDWNNTADPASPGISIINHWNDIECHDNNGIGIQIGGPTDAQWKSVNSYKNGSHNYHFAPNAVGIVLSQCHGWEPPLSVGAVTFLCEAGGTKFSNCQMEGSDTCELAIIANDVEFQGGEIFNPTGFSGATTATGVQIGQSAGNTPIPGQIQQSGGHTTAWVAAGTMINTKIDNCQGAAIDYQNEVNSDVTALIWANGGNVLKSGRTPNYVDRIFHNVDGVTSDGSMNTSPRYGFGGAGNNMFTLLGADGTPLINANGTNNILSFANSTKMNGYSDYYSTQTFSIDMANGSLQLGGSISTAESASAAAIANGNTITTTNIGEARVAPTGNVTGIILQAGVQKGQEVAVVNESAFNVTMAASGTSHVADGVSAVIAANRCMFFKWDSITSLWYHS
ncbi:MAG TPA: hypothetical protein VHV10_06940 [Ktedonobacteraceae bacterium]|jgi:hypothetical protein|nr:hypothetical protein [Ktedonobacteraceae bacterium]